MRNYLQIPYNLRDNHTDNHTDNNTDNNTINNLYVYLKNNFNNHTNSLKEYKNSLKQEDRYFIILSERINSDFNNSNDYNLDKNQLSKQYVNIVNETDYIYNNKKNTIYENIKKHQMYNIEVVNKLKSIHSYLKNVFYLKNYIYKFLNLSSKKFNKNKLKNAITKIIQYRERIDNNLDNSLTNTENSTKYNLDFYKKRINNISNIIDKNNILLLNLDSNIKNSTDKKEKHYLKILYDNSQNNKKIFGGKLEKYFIKLNNITNNIDKNINIDKNMNIDKNNINSQKYTELIKYIQYDNGNSYKKNMKHIINLLMPLIFNKKYMKLSDIKNLLKKYTNLSY